jgi:hypothetical protein
MNFSKLTFSFHGLYNTDYISVWTDTRHTDSIINIIKMFAVFNIIIVTLPYLVNENICLKLTRKCEISGSHGGEYENDSLLGYFIDWAISQL